MFLLVFLSLFFLFPRLQITIRITNIEVIRPLFKDKQNIHKLLQNIIKSHNKIRLKQDILLHWDSKIYIFKVILANNGKMNTIATWCTINNIRSFAIFLIQMVTAKFAYSFFQFKLCINDSYYNFCSL